MRNGQLEAACKHFEEVIALAGEIGSAFHLVNSSGNLGFLRLVAGELKEAALFSRQSLIAGRRTGRPASVAFAIFLLACCATGDGDYCRAAQLAGAHDAIDAALTDALPNHSWTSPEQRVRDDNRARLRLALGRTRGEPAAMLRTVTCLWTARGPVRRPARQIIPAERVPSVRCSVSSVQLERLVRGAVLPVNVRSGAGAVPMTSRNGRHPRCPVLAPRLLID